MRYAKTWIAAAIAGLTVLASALTDNKITADEWLAIGLAVLGVFGVWATPNKPAAGDQ